MNVSATFFGSVVLIWVVVGTALTYFLAKERYRNPWPTVFLGFVLSFFPPISILFLVVMALFKKELSREQSGEVV